jgi:hypothetical protein
LTLTGFGIASLLPTPLIRQVLAGSLTDDRRLLFVFLHGGSDGINALIPHGDVAYNTTNRPTLQIPAADAIDLNGFASLHPSLGDMVDAFDAGDLAAIHRVGYADNSRSHFDGQRIWENGDPARAQLFEGWLYRYVQEAAVSAGADLPLITVQSTPPVLVRGEEKFVNVASPDNFSYIIGDPPRSKLAGGWEETASDLLGLEKYRPVLSQTGVKLADTFDEYESWDQANWDPKDPDTGWSLFPVSAATNQAGFSAQSYDFFGALKVSALAARWLGHAQQSRADQRHAGRVAEPVGLRVQVAAHRPVGCGDGSPQLHLDLGSNDRAHDVGARPHQPGERQLWLGSRGSELSVRHGRHGLRWRVQL